MNRRIAQDLLRGLIAAVIAAFIIQSIVHTHGIGSSIPIVGSRLWAFAGGLLTLLAVTLPLRSFLRALLLAAYGGVFGWAIVAGVCWLFSFDRHQASLYAAGLMGWVFFCFGMLDERSSSKADARLADVLPLALLESGLSALILGAIGWGIFRLLGWKISPYLHWAISVGTGFGFIDGWRSEWRKRTASPDPVRLIRYSGIFEVAAQLCVWIGLGVTIYSVQRVQTFCEYHFLITGLTLSIFGYATVLQLLGLTAAWESPKNSFPAATIYPHCFWRYDSVLGWDAVGYHGIGNNVGSVDCWSPLFFAGAVLFAALMVLRAVPGIQDPIRFSTVLLDSGPWQMTAITSLGASQLLIVIDVSRVFLLRRQLDTRYTERIEDARQKAVQSVRFLFLGLVFTIFLAIAQLLIFLRHVHIQWLDRFHLHY